MKKIKSLLKRNPALYSGITALYSLLSPFFKAVDPTMYWEQRYRKGENSGAGSYGKFSAFKAGFINDFVLQHDIQSAIEFGVGDGAQLEMIDYPSYIGLDVSVAAIEMCKNKFSKDGSKSFFLYNARAFEDKLGIFVCDLSLSLDVLFHITEDDIFKFYLDHLFSSSRKYVIIYSSNDPSIQSIGKHVRHRRFTDYIEKYHKDWCLNSFEKNRYPYNGNDEETSFADFYVFQKIEK